MRFCNLSTYGLPLNFDEVEQNTLQFTKIDASVAASWTSQHTKVLITSWKRCYSAHSLAAAKGSQPLHADVLEGTWEVTMKVEGKEPRE